MGLMSNGKYDRFDKEDLFLNLCNNDYNLCKEWHFAKWFIDTKLNNKRCLDQVTPDSKDCLTVIFKGYSDHVVAVARQIALFAHFLNYDEDTCENVTNMYFVVPNVSKTDKRLSTYPFFMNLYNYCNSEKHRYLDIRIKVVHIGSEIIKSKNTIELSRAEIDSAFIDYLNDLSIQHSDDIRKAKRVNMVYNIGHDLDNIPVADTERVKSYASAIHKFSYKIKAEEEQQKWDAIKEIRLKISSFFCAENLNRYKDEIHNMDVIKREIKVYSRCEHARWNVEKLILGYRPFSDKEMYQWSTSFGTTKKRFYDKKKNVEFVHPCICSYHDLKRIRPMDMKYDTFIQLVMNNIKEAAKNI